MSGTTLVMRRETTFAAMPKPGADYSLMRKAPAFNAGPIMREGPKRVYTVTADATAFPDGFPFKRGQILRIDETTRKTVVNARGRLRWWLFNRRRRHYRMWFDVLEYEVRRSR